MLRILSGLYETIWNIEFEIWTIVFRYQAVIGISTHFIMGEMIMEVHAFVDDIGGGIYTGFVAVRDILKRLEVLEVGDIASISIIKSMGLYGRV